MYRVTEITGSLGEREMLWENKPTGKCFNSIFEFSQGSTSFSIKQLDYELEISIA